MKGKKFGQKFAVWMLTFAMVVTCVMAPAGAAFAGTDLHSADGVYPAAAENGGTEGGSTGGNGQSDINESVSMKMDDYYVTRSNLVSNGAEFVFKLPAGYVFNESCREVGADKINFKYEYTRAGQQELKAAFDAATGVAEGGVLTVTVPAVDAAFNNFATGANSGDIAVTAEFAEGTLTAHRTSDEAGTGEIAVKADNSVFEIREEKAEAYVVDENDNKVELTENDIKKGTPRYIVIKQIGNAGGSYRFTLYPGSNGYGRRERVCKGVFSTDAARMGSSTDVNAELNKIINYWLGTEGTDENGNASYRYNQQEWLYCTESDDFIKFKVPQIADFSIDEDLNIYARLLRGMVGGTGGGGGNPSLDYYWGDKGQMPLVIKNCKSEYPQVTDIKPVPSPDPDYSKWIEYEGEQGQPADISDDNIRAYMFHGKAPYAEEYGVKYDIKTNPDNDPHAENATEDSYFENRIMNKLDAGKEIKFAFYVAGSKTASVESQDPGAFERNVKPYISIQDAKTNEIVWFGKDAIVKDAGNGGTGGGMGTGPKRGFDVQVNVKAGTLEAGHEYQLVIGKGLSGKSRGGKTYPLKYNITFQFETASEDVPSGGGSHRPSVPDVKPEIEKNPDGSVTETVKKEDGSTVATTKKTDGTVIETVTKKDGSVAAEVKVPEGKKEVVVNIPKKELKPGEVAVIVKPDGTREVIKKSVADKDGIKVQLDGSAKIEIVDNSKSFNDVADNHWAEKAVDFVTSHEIFNGTGNGAFAPETGMTRGMLVKVLHNFENNPESVAAGNFGDVAGDAWYAEAVKWAAGNGIVSGTGDGEFAPNDEITREQLATILYRYAGKNEVKGEPGKFSDASKVSGYAKDAMIWAVESGLINGMGNNELNPQGSATRAQVAAIMMRFCEMIVK